VLALSQVPMIESVPGFFMDFTGWRLLDILKEQGKDCDSRGENRNDRLS